MKKTVFTVLILSLLLASCDRKAFVKKLTGTWTLDRYLYGGQDFSTKMKDTTMTNYRLVLDENQSFIETWESYTYFENFYVDADTSFDIGGNIVGIEIDTVRFTDTIVAPFSKAGGWELINSEEDLQLRDAATNDVRIYRILRLTGSSLNMRKGNEEIYLKSL